MSWFVDNANVLYILFGLVAAGLVALWWLNKRTKYLVYAAGVLVLVGPVWLTTRFVVSDSKQLERNVHAMATAVENGKVDDLFKHFARDFTYHGMNRDMLQHAARAAIEKNKVSEVRITQFQVEEISRANKFAKTRFRVTAWGAGIDHPYPFVTQADFV